MSALHVAKSRLRKEIKKNLASLSFDDKKKQSEAVVRKVLTSSWFSDCRRVSLFLSMPNEVDTLPILKAALDAGKQCFIPHYKGSEMHMVMLESMEDYNRLPLTKWNIKQPADHELRPEALETGGLDLILVPGVAFTRHGARLGHGKGYYDAYLNRYRSAGLSPTTVALAFRQQLVDNIPLSEHDQFVHHVLWHEPEHGS